MGCAIWRPSVQKRRKNFDSAPNRVPTTRDGGGTTCARGGGQSNEESKNIGRELHRSCALSRWTQCAESIRSHVDTDRRSRFHSQGGWQRCPVTPRFHWRVNWEWFRVVGARYGMRGVRLVSDHDEWTAPDSVIDALEADLTPPVPSTIPSVGAVMRRMQGDVPAVRGSRFAVLSESDVENDDEPMVRPAEEKAGRHWNPSIFRSFAVQPRTPERATHSTNVDFMGHRSLRMDGMTCRVEFCCQLQWFQSERLSTTQTTQFPCTSKGTPSGSHSARPSQCERFVRHSQSPVRRPGRFLQEQRQNGSMLHAKFSRIDLLPAQLRLSQVWI